MITHPEKVLFPDDGITKADLAAYYESVAAIMVPHICGRPVTLERYPAGIGGKGFWQKDVSRISRVAGTGRGTEERRDSPPSDQRHAIAPLDGEPEHDPPHVCIPCRRSTIPTSAFRSRSVARR
jgi:hypothetical protein